MGTMALRANTPYPVKPESGIRFFPTLAYLVLSRLPSDGRPIQRRVVNRTTNSLIFRRTARKQAIPSAIGERRFRDCALVEDALTGRRQPPRLGLYPARWKLSRREIAGSEDHLQRQLNLARSGGR
jgi:hypothetical protein